MPDFTRFGVGGRTAKRGSSLDGLSDRQWEVRLRVSMQINLSELEVLIGPSKTAKLVSGKFS
jgi:hypothetical protein